MLKCLANHRAVLRVTLSLALAWLLPAAAAAQPNVVIILADDLGFSDVGCYGGEIATPNLDRLATNGLRFTQFYNTARCWPTRAALLTGYYAQQIRGDQARGPLPTWTRMLPHYLKPAGYRSYHVGKWHVHGAPRPVADGGFDRSYWFQDWDRYFSPTNHFRDDVLAPPVQPDSGYYATTAFADEAIGFLHDHATNHAARPFFLYLAFVAPHFPLHALPEDIARYRDRYAEGWDVFQKKRYDRQRAMGLVDFALPPLEPELTPRYFKPAVLETLGPGEVQHAVPWEQLTSEQQQFQALKMAIHAAMVDRMDREIGRVVEQLRAMGALEDTLILFLSDNGTDATIMVRGDGHDQAAPPGSWASFLCLGPGWSSVGNTPFRRHKIWTHEGGISTPLIAHWPKGIAARGEFRRAPGHVIDLVPTLLDLAGITPGDSWNESKAPPLPGHSLAPAFAEDVAIPREFLFFHHAGNRALRKGDWKIVSASEDADAWELYDLSKGRCETVNLAAQHPDMVKEMAAFWTRQNETYLLEAGPPPQKPPAAGKKKEGL